MSVLKHAFSFFFEWELPRFPFPAIGFTIPGWAQVYFGLSARFFSSPGTVCFFFPGISTERPSTPHPFVLGVNSSFLMVVKKSFILHTSLLPCSRQGNFCILPPLFPVMEELPPFEGFSLQNQGSEVNLGDTPPFFFPWCRHVLFHAEHHFSPGKNYSDPLIRAQGQCTRFFSH